jgi:hypothetical protein
MPRELAKSTGFREQAEANVTLHASFCLPSHTHTRTHTRHDCELSFWWGVREIGVWLRANQGGESGYSLMTLQFGGGKQNATQNWGGE